MTTLFSAIYPLVGPLVQLCAVGSDRQGTWSEDDERTYRFREKDYGLWV